jgi:serpin B
MRVNRILARLAAAILPLSFILASHPVAPAAQTRSLVEGNTAFAFDLYGQLKTAPGNLFFSPYSVSTCLGMTYAGARGETEKQMGQVLHFGPDFQQVHAGFGELGRQLAAVGQQQDLELSLANALWGQKGYPFLPAFLQVARAEYQANLNQTDFATGAEAARGEINRWVAQKTKEKIQDILPPGSIEGTSRLVLANAIYFKGAWTKSFERSATSIQPFHRAGATPANVPLMHKFDEVRYVENDEFQAVELPYARGELSMVVLLPRQIEGCGKLEGRLRPALLASALGQMKKQRVEIFLPRFKLESSFKLNDTLARMGMRDAFYVGRADFSGLGGSRGDLWISGIFHKAWGEVNEEGTEAAAATATVIKARAIARPMAPPPVFRADHPFLFLIRDTRTGSLLFLGRLAEPSR